MKTFFTLLALTLLVFGSANATMHNVGVANYQFSPSSFNANVGDSITWTMNGGIAHTTTSVSIPAGADTWDHTFNGVGQSFIYVITTPGTYNYHCDFHYATNGMIASFTVSSSTGVKGMENNNVPRLVLPNPFTGNMVINYDKPSTVTIFNLLGDKITGTTLQNPSGSVELNFSGLLPGMYIVSLVSEGTLVETRKFIKQY